MSRRSNSTASATIAAPESITLPESGVVTAPAAPPAAHIPALRIIDDNGVESASFESLRGNGILSPAEMLDVSLTFITAHFKLPSAKQALRALSAAKLVSDASATQGQEDARLPILSESSRHSTSSKDSQGKEGRVIIRDTSTLSAEQVKARKSRERVLNAALVLALR